MAEQRKEEEVKRKAEEVSMVDLNQSSFSLKTYAPNSHAPASRNREIKFALDLGINSSSIS